MKAASFEFDPELTQLLPASWREGARSYQFTGPQSAKHLIESLGIPHTEIGGVTANGDSVDLGYLVRDGDDIQVTGLSDGGPPPDEPLFVIDGHLGRLNSGLRMLGLDCLYRGNYTDDDLAETSAQQGRFLLSRDRRLLMRKAVTRGYLVRTLDPALQLKEVVRRFGLRRWIRPFRRCIRCNHLLSRVEKSAILQRLQPLTRLYFEEFHICPSCNQIYWKGSHFERMLHTISKIQGLDSRP